MRVVINAVAARMGGAATHLPNFLRAAGRRYAGDMFIACVNSQWRGQDLGENVRLVDAGDLQGILPHAVWDQWGVARLALRERADVLVSLLNFGPIHSPVPHLVFERNPVYFCRDYLRALSGTGALQVAATRALVHAVMRAADRIVTPSASMREMIREFYPRLPLDKFRVVPHGFALEDFERPSALSADVAAHLDSSTGIRLLYVSHAAAYKGIDILLEASRLLRDRGGAAFTTWLTIAQEDWPEGMIRYVSFIERHGLSGQIRLLGRVPHRAISHLYRAADLFIYPSLCESFGFPLVEAMAVGLPIVAGDRPLNREMCGDAAVYYPARDPVALAETITSLANDVPRQTSLASAAESRSRAFSWNHHVDAVMRIVLEVTGRSKAGQALPG
jgi:glycosyltransferase involved in cell wall biosynthesis